MAIGCCISAYFLIVLVVLSYSGQSNRHIALLESMVIAIIVWMSSLLIGTELLSLLNALKYRPLLLFYISINLILALWIFQRRQLVKLNFYYNFDPDRFSAGMIAFMFSIAALAAVMAFCCPPNNPDSLSYHLPRQIYWMQQGSLAHFQTPNDRQIMMPPLSEIIGLHFRILSKGDLWSNLAQFGSYILGGLCAALIARELGADGPTRIFAAFLVFTIPMAFHQASNTKNDLILSMLLSALTWQLVRYIRFSNFSWCNWVLVGLNLGLVWMTKGTGIIFSVSVMIAFGIVIFYRRGLSAYKAIVVISIFAVVLSFGHYSRNFRWYGSIFGDVKRPGYDLVIRQPSLKSLLSNVIRNLSLHLGAPHAGWNARHYRIVQVLHNWMKIDLNDPRTTYWSDKLKFNVGYAPQTETKAPAPIHLAAAFLVPFLLAASKSRGSSLKLLIWSLPFFSFILFCLFVKWQPWHARLHLPLFSLACPVIAVSVAAGKKGRAAAAALAILICLTMLPALNSFSRPVFKANNIFNTHSIDLQYRYFPEWKQPHLEIYKLVEYLEPACVQFDLEWAWQYPLQQMILKKSPNPPIFWGQVSPSPSPAADFVVTWAGNSEKSLFNPKLGVHSMIKIDGYNPFIVFAAKDLLSARKKKSE